ncbi:MAG: hypothetical protein BM557_03385 [Flavobacterium sp. MedPE-SWcel]|uniref:DUF3857 domain-containing protein n=1 Tax=uncultured Flavobacterium sp. TaxID=165435 RepID=UPI000922CC13|nr:DUF3857 domain-containing protein [uncultured Flavobacterium sp.]OIQ21307.1 MAG: hypothetical protein BM557_03385 [Flavobacterium sp. MedPE-SWcel]
MNLKVIIVFLLLFLSKQFYAQKFELGKVSVKELQEKSHPNDPDATAAILFREGKTYFVLTSDSRLIMVTEVKTRIKIYTKEGYKYATDELVYYTGGKRIRANYSDVCTYNLENGEIKKTKLKREGEFKEEVTENYSIKKITLPNVKEGSVIEYKYTVKTPYFSIFSDYFFQFDIPVNEVSYNVAIPACFIYKKYLHGYVDVKVSDVKKIAGDTRYGDVVFTYSAKDVKALKDEGFVDNLENYRSVLKHELASTHFEGEEVKRYSILWSDVAKKIYEDDDFGKELNKYSYFEDDVEALLMGVNTLEQKINVVFNYVKSRMNWNGRNSYFCKEGVKKAYKNKVGNVAEINLMLTAILRYAGLDANPVLVSTRSNGIVDFPSRMGFNYVVSAVNVGNELKLLDATSKYTVPGILPKRALNWKGRLIKIDGSNQEVNMLPKEKSLKNLTILADISEQGTISGKTRYAFLDYEAYSFRKEYGGLSNEMCIAAVENRYDKITIDDYELSNVTTNLLKPVKQSYTFRTDDYVEFIGDKMYLSPMLFYTLSENPFKQEERKYPIDFVFPKNYKTIMLINIPDGYTVESIPDNINVKMEQNIGSFKYRVAYKGNQLQVVTNTMINYNNVSSEYYTTLKDFYRKIIEKKSEKIVLKKI